MYGAKRPTTGPAANTVCTWDKETYYWCWLKYVMYMGQRGLLLVLAYVRSVHSAKRPTTGAGSNTVSTWGKETYYFFFSFFFFFFFAVPSTVPTSEALLPRHSFRHPLPPATPRAHSASRPRPQRSTGSDVRSLVGCHPKETLHCC